MDDKMQMILDTLSERVSALSPKKQARILSFVKLIETEADSDDGIYEDLSFDVEDKLIQSLTFAPGVWGDE
jgi:hypothetical protein